MQVNKTEQMDDEMYYNFFDESDEFSDTHQPWPDNTYQKMDKSKNKEFSESKKARQTEREQQRKMKRNNNWEN